MYFTHKKAEEQTHKPVTVRDDISTQYFAELRFDLFGESLQTESIDWLRVSGPGGPRSPIRSLQTTLQHAEIIGREQELKCRFYQAFDRCWICRAQVHGGVQLGSHHNGWVACCRLVMRCTKSARVPQLYCIDVKRILLISMTRPGDAGRGGGHHGRAAAGLESQ